MKVCVIGGGAAGMIAAGYSALNGNETYLFEKNEKLGKKVYITGKGRCNVTNNVDPQEFLKNVVRNGKFLMSAINRFTPAELMNLLESYGIQLKTERGNRVFPVSDKSSDIIKGLANFTYSSGVNVRLNEEVKDIIVDNGKAIGIILAENNKLFFDKIIIATGGISYKATGSTGDGYKFARKSGHNIVETVPSLIGIDVNYDKISELSGLSLRNISLTICDESNKVYYSGFGELLFTHTGISGPLTLSASAFINRTDVRRLKAVIDMKPALTDETLDKRIQSDLKKYNNKIILNSLSDLLPKSIIESVITMAGIDTYKQSNSITKEERSRLVHTIKNFELKLNKLGDINNAVVTSGGIDTKEINPKTMESKLVTGLFFAGEVIDVDALTGGFNLQIAFSTGYCAGN